MIQIALMSIFVTLFTLGVVSLAIGSLDRRDKKKKKVVDFFLICSDNKKSNKKKKAYE